MKVIVNLNWISFLNEKKRTAMFIFDTRAKAEKFINGIPDEAKIGYTILETEEI